jgi:flagellar biosynthesis chaperone FliJ
MWRLRRKNERGWNDGFHINTRDEAKALCELLNKLEREVAEAKEQCSNLDDQVSSAIMVIRGFESERDEAREQIEANHKATLVIERMFYEAREQRDRLAEAIHETLMQNLHLADGDDCTLKRLKDSIQFELPNE